MRFTGKYSIVNKILNSSQLRKVQGSWLIKNTYMVNRWSDKTIDFINKNKWCAEFLNLNLITNEEIESQIRMYDMRKNPKKHSKYSFETV